MKSPDRQAHALPRREGLLPLACVCYLLAFTGGGLRVYLSGDDLMNLHGYWLAPWEELIQANLLFFSSYYRPLGGLYYRGLYAVFGLDPAPFRMACFALLAANIVLTFLVVRRLTASRWQAAVASLLFAYHGQMADLYYNGGAIYDLLCFFFAFGAFLAYLETSEAQPGRPWLVAALFVAALNAKEMAVTLPLAVALFEILFASPAERPVLGSWAGLWRRYRTFAIVSAIAGLYAAGKLSTANPLVDDPGYAPEFSIAAYLRASAHYVGILFYRPHSLDPLCVTVVWAAMAVVAAALRSRVLWFALFYILISILPIAFIPLRSGFVYYLPAFGWALFLAAASEPAMRRLARVLARKGGAERPHAGAAAFVATALLITPVHLVERDSFRALLLPALAQIRDAATQLEPRLSELRRARSVLLLDDPAEDWWPYYLVRLAHGDPAVLVHRVQRQQGETLRAERAVYDAVVQFHGAAFSVEVYPHPEAASGKAVAVRFSPATIQPGEAYTIEISEMPGATIDLAYQAGSGFFRARGVSEAFCTLDLNGRAVIQTPPGQPLGPIGITHVRDAYGLWRPGYGKIVVADHPAPR